MSENSALSEQLIDLQTRVAHQDDALLKLNDVIAQQQQDLLRLEKSVQELAKQLRAVRENAPAASGGQHELPPHY